MANEVLDTIKADAQVVGTKVETAVTGWRISGWAAVAAMVAANLVGVFFHF